MRAVGAAWMHAYHNTAPPPRADLTWQAGYGWSGDEATASSNGRDNFNNNPFVRFRPFLFSYRTALARGMTDAEYVDLVQHCTRAVASVDAGRTMQQTPISFDTSLVCKHCLLYTSPSPRDRG